MGLLAKDLARALLQSAREQEARRATAAALRDLATACREVAARLSDPLPNYFSSNGDPTHRGA